MTASAPLRIHHTNHRRDGRRRSFLLEAIKHTTDSQEVIEHA